MARNGLKGPKGANGIMGHKLANGSKGPTGTV